MNASELLTSLYSHNVNVWAENEKLKIDAPKGALSDEMKDQLRAHKAEIIEHLKMLAMRDFCGVCKARLIRQRNGEWNCPTVNCFESRVLRSGKYEN